MKADHLRSLVALVEVATFVWIAFAVCVFLGALEHMATGTPPQEPSAIAAVSIAFGAAGAVAGWGVRRGLLRRLKPHSRGFPVLPPR